MKIIKSILTKSSCYKAGAKITPKGLMLHSVGCSQPSASVFVKRWNGDVDACVHAFIDGNTGDVYQTLPWNHRAWHCARSGNNTHIGVEMCEPACIDYTGGSGFTCSDKAEAKAVVKRTYESAVALFAYLCKEYKLDPMKDGVIVSHKEGYKRGIASNHGDPEHIWNGLKMGYTMDGFRKAVKAAMKGSPVKTETKPAASNTATPANTTYSLKQFIKDVQKATGAEVDGIAGPETLSKTPTLSKNKNTRHAVVKAVQKRLNALGYNCGTVDGIAGPKFDAAVKKFQKANGCVGDGEITAKMKTWQKLLGMA